MRKMLAFIDGSIYSDSVCDHVIWAAAGDQFDVSLFNVIEGASDVDVPSNFSGNLSAEAKNKLLSELSELDQKRAKLAQKKGRLVLDLARERLMIFQKKAQEIKLTYRKTLFNQTSKVLFENKSKDKNQFFGRDEFQNSVVVKTEENLKGKIKDVKIIDGNQNTLFGEIVPNIDKKEFAA